MPGLDFILLAAAPPVPGPAGRLTKKRKSAVFNRSLSFYISSVEDSIEIIKKIIEIYKKSMLIRELVVKLTRDKKGIPGRIAAIYSFATKRVKYLNDILNVETLQSPIQTLKSRAGDCDDFAILISTLLAAIGIPSFLVLSSNRKDGLFNHIYNAVPLKGKLLFLDGTIKTIGKQRPDILKKRLVKVD
jgi:hypothetical protein